MPSVYYVLRLELLFWKLTLIESLLIGLLKRMVTPNYPEDLKSLGELEVLGRPPNIFY
jgi:hypothetical protein